MRILVWNANMAVHAKLDLVVARYAPDVAVLPECADEQTLRTKAGTRMPD